MAGELFLVPINDLVDEIERRCDVSIIAFVQNVGNKEEDAFVNYHGGKFACIGLCNHVKDVLLDKARRAIIEGTGGPE